VLAVAGTSVLAFRKLDSARRSFLSGHPQGLLERMREAVALEGCKQGSFGFLPDGLEILSETAGARDETKRFFNGLISQPA